jgi:ABC-type siderophore export system fused ATPase/permease subunit
MTNPNDPADEFFRKARENDPAFIAAEKARLEQERLDREQEIKLAEMRRQVEADDRRRATERKKAQDERERNVRENLRLVSINIHTLTVIGIFWSIVIWFSYAATMHEVNVVGFCILSFIAILIASAAARK